MIQSSFSRFLIEYWYFASMDLFAYKYILSVSSWLFIISDNAFVCPDPEPPCY